MDVSYTVNWLGVVFIYLRLRFKRVRNSGRSSPESVEPPESRSVDCDTAALASPKAAPGDTGAPPDEDDEVDTPIGE